MKILVGIDRDLQYRPVLPLLARLRFQGAKVSLAHAQQTSLIPVFGAAEAAFGSEPASRFDKTSDVVTVEALETAKALGLDAETAVLSGAAVPALLEFASREDTDLIAIHSVRKSALGSLFLGSVARGLAMGSSQSLLISKEDRPGKGPVSAVFATDHSAYATRAIDKLIQFGAAGLRDIHIISAAWLPDYEPEETHFEDEQSEGITQAWLEAQLSEKNAEAAAQLQAAGYSVTTQVDSAKPVEAIRRAMDSRNADILIMGAQGHGFIHRLFIGSTSLHQVVAEKHSILLLRVPHREP